jgi:hypothetical protein
MIARLVAVLQRKLGRDDATIAPNMTKEEAIELARRTAESDGWPFLPEYFVTYRAGWFGQPGLWHVNTNGNRMNLAVNFTIDDRQRAVVHKHYFRGVR